MDREFSFREEALVHHREGKRALPAPPFRGFGVTLAIVVVLAGLVALTLTLPVNTCMQGNARASAQRVDLLHFLWSPPSRDAAVACP